VTPEQRDLVKNTIAKGATDEELKLYFYDCERRNVHPLDKLIHFTKRGGKYTPITSIDFMRSRAQETGECAGSDDAIFGDGPNGLEASVTVYRVVQGIRCPFTATARWAEYYPGDQQGMMWKKMPHTMLGKCAEALALRKGFPQQLAGLYSREEMDQAGAQPVVNRASPPSPPKIEGKPQTEIKLPPQSTKPPGAPSPIMADVTPSGGEPVISEPQRKRLFAIWKESGWEDKDFHAAMIDRFDIKSTKEIPKPMYEAVCNLAKVNPDDYFKSVTGSEDREPADQYEKAPF
jgi:phage recombination protein Bet